MKKIKYFYSLIYLIVLFAVTGCSTSIAVKARSDSRIDVGLDMAAGPVMQQLLGLYGVAVDAGTLSQMKKGLEESFFYNVKTDSPSPTSFAVSGTVLPVSTQSIISRKEHSLTLNLSPSEIQAFVHALPEDVRSYLDLFAAPVFTGDALTREEYTSLISIIYGQRLAKELDDADIKITLESPTGKKTEFKLPVMEFLTLTEDKSFSIKF